MSWFPGNTMTTWVSLHYHNLCHIFISTTCPMTLHGSVLRSRIGFVHIPAWFHQQWPLILRVCVFLSIVNWWSEECFLHSWGKLCCAITNGLSYHNHISGTAFGRLLFLLCSLFFILNLKITAFCEMWPFKLWASFVSNEAYRFKCLKKFIFLRFKPLKILVSCHHIVTKEFLL